MRFGEVIKKIEKLDAKLEKETVEKDANRYREIIK